jgi:hypothetical protein
MQLFITLTAMVKVAIFVWKVMEVGGKEAFK